MIARDDLYERLRFIQRGRMVRRFHTFPVLDMQRIDGHSYGVAMLTEIIVPEAPADRALRLLRAGMRHDLAEHRTGDMPAPAKRRMGIREQFSAVEDEELASVGLLQKDRTPADERVLKLADAGDGCLHCIEERSRGNGGIREAFMNFWSYMINEQEFREVHRQGGIEAGEPALYDYITSEWIGVNGSW